MKVEIENARSDDASVFIGENDIGHRVVTVEGKYKYILRSQDPYGFIKVSTVPPSNLPKILKGTFTDPSAAIHAIIAHVNAKSAEKNKPPRDKNTRKIQELLKANAEAE